MEETPLSQERLTSMVKGGAVENITSSGYTPSGREMDILYNADQILYYASRTEDLRNSHSSTKSFTRLTIVPLSFPKIVPNELKGRYDKKDYAVCLAYQGINTDRSHRNAVLAAVAIMSEEDASDFVGSVKKTPTLVYSLVRHLNGSKPITRFDGNPAEISPGEKVEIIPNIKLGGNIDKKTETAPFPEGFDPNPVV